MFSGLRLNLIGLHNIISCCDGIRR